MSKGWIIDYMEEQRIIEEVEQYEMQEAYERGEYHPSSSNKEQTKLFQDVSKPKVEVANSNEQNNHEILELRKKVKELNEEILYIKKFIGLK